MNDDKIAIEITSLITVTNKAYLVGMDWIDDNFKMWLPKAHCDVSDDTIYVARWLVKAKADELDLQDFYDLL